MLGQAGKDVTLLARGEALRDLRQRGLEMTDGLTGERLTARVNLIEQLDREDHYDLVIVPMVKASRHAVCPVLAKSDHLENILFLGNDVSGPAGYLEHLSPEQVLVGFPRAGGGWDGEDLVIIDRDKPKQRGSIHFGELDGRTRLRTVAIRRFFDSAGLDARVERDMDGWLKYHFAFIAPMCGVIFQHGMDLDAAAADPKSLHDFCRACREAGDVLQAIGYTRRQPAIFNLFYWLPRWLEPKIFSKLFGSPAAKIRFGLHAGAVRPELLGLIAEFQALRDGSGVQTPTLDALFTRIISPLQETPLKEAS